MLMCPNITNLGPYLHTLPISRLPSCSSDIREDTQTFGIACVKHLLDVTEVTVHYESDITRLRREAKVHTGFANGDVVAFTNATILTMQHGGMDLDIITEGTVVVRGGFIEAVGKTGEVPIPEGGLVIQAGGGRAGHGKFR